MTRTRGPQADGAPAVAWPMILLRLALLLGRQRHASRIVALSDPTIASRAKKGDEDVSQVLMCYSPQESLQPTTLNVIEWPHDSPGLALSSLSRDRHRAPWSDPARQATVPVPRTTLRGAYVPAGI